MGAIRLATSTTTDEEYGGVYNTIDSANSGGTIAVNSTWQIPADVWSHKLVNLEFRRGGIGGYITIDTATAPYFNNGLQVTGVSGYYYSFTVSSTGLITVTGKSQALDSPYIFANGYL